VCGTIPFLRRNAMSRRDIQLMRGIGSALIGGVSGAVGTAAVGALIGLALWLTGVGFAYSWLDWPIGGAIFGVVVGGLGGTIGGASQGVWGRVAVVLGAVLGAVAGSLPSWQSGTTAEILFFAICGAVGGATGAAFGVMAKFPKSVR
jgi:hypothetical protein